MERLGAEPCAVAQHDNDRSKESCLSNQETSIPSDIKRKSSVFRSSIIKKTRRTHQSAVEPTTPIKKEDTSNPGNKYSVKQVTKDKQKPVPRAPQVSQPSYKKDEITQTVSKSSPTIEKIWNAKATFSCFKSFQDVSPSHKNSSKRTASPSSRLAKSAYQTKKSSGTKSNVSHSLSSCCFWRGEKEERKEESPSRRRISGWRRNSVEVPRGRSSQTPSRMTDEALKSDLSRRR